MHHRRLLTSSILAGGLLAGTGALAAEPEQAWQATGLDGPESAVLDADAGVLYVSNVNGEANAADGNGYISKLSLNGEIQDKEWVTGLNAPKGLALHDGKLYVSDIDELVVIDTASGEITARHEARGATFLNDVTAHEDGRVFVSDMMQNQIWKLEGDQFEMWLQDQALENPNGLLAEKIVWWSEPGASRRRTSPPTYPATSRRSITKARKSRASGQATRSATWTGSSRTARAGIS
jgi:sugar lactone lactonase YvrE